METFFQNSNLQLLRHFLAFPNQLTSLTPITSNLFPPSISKAMVLVTFKTIDHKKIDPKTNEFKAIDLEM